MPRRNIRSDFKPGFTSATPRGIEKGSITKRAKRNKVTIAPMLPLDRDGNLILPSYPIEDHHALERAVHSGLKRGNSSRNYR